MTIKRIPWIDLARGIGIIFVIYSHVLRNSGYSYLFFAFHMPLFFFLSGVVLKTYDRFITILKKSAQGLLIPYFIFAFIMYDMWLFHILAHHLALTSQEATKQLFGIFYGSSNNGYLIFNDVLWFLPTLFITRILFASLIRIVNKTKFVVLLLVCFSIFGYLFSLFEPTVKAPFGIEIALTAIVFYGAGFLWNRSEKAKALVLQQRYLLFPFFLLLGSILATVDYALAGHSMIDLRFNHLNNYFLFYIDAFSGIFAWIAFSMILKTNQLLETIGRNSLILFAWHPIAFIYVGQALNSALLSPTIRHLTILIPALYTTIAISIIFGCNFVLKKLTQLFHI